MLKDKFSCHTDWLVWTGVNNALQGRHNGHDSVSNHQPDDCLFNRLFGRRSKKTSKLRVTGLCAGNSPGTGEFPVHMASNAENVSIWWRHHGKNVNVTFYTILGALKCLRRWEKPVVVLAAWHLKDCYYTYNFADISSLLLYSETDKLIYKLYENATRVY